MQTDAPTRPRPKFKLPNPRVASLAEVAQPEPGQLVRVEGHLLGRSHAISVDLVRRRPEEEGVLLAMGDHAAGFALYVKGNRLVYDHRCDGVSRRSLASEYVLPVGALTCRLEFAHAPGREQAVVTLYVDGHQAAELFVDHTLECGPTDEAMEIGRDSGAPASAAYAAPFPFAGEITRVRIEVGENDVPHDRNADAERLDAAGHPGEVS